MRRKKKKINLYRIFGAKQKSFDDYPYTHDFGGETYTKHASTRNKYKAREIRDRIKKSHDVRVRTTGSKKKGYLYTIYKKRR